LAPSISPWIEIESPFQKRLELPISSGRITFGRSRTNTVLIDDARVSRQHCQLAFDNGRWMIRDLGSGSGFFVNTQKSNERVLFDGDVIEFPPVRMVFRDPPAQEDVRFIEAITSNEASNEPWLIYADRLQEIGDPLGERMMLSHENKRVDHAHWLKDLWPLVMSGQLELQFRFGFIQKATIRQVAGRLDLDILQTVQKLFALRISQFIQSLIIMRSSIAEAETLASDFANLSNAPKTLNLISFGAQFGIPRNLQMDAAFQLAFPRVKQLSVFKSSTHFFLKQLNNSSNLKTTGFNEGSRQLIQGVVTRIRKDNSFLHFETPNIGRHQLDGNPTYFASNEEQRPILVSGKLKGEIKVNGRNDTLHYLLPSDKILVCGVPFSFELP
jgi:uncharacterized protein (TIGR02996 family)